MSPFAGLPSIFIDQFGRPVRGVKDGVEFTVQAIFKAEDEQDKINRNGNRNDVQSVVKKAYISVKREDAALFPMHTPVLVDSEATATLVGGKYVFSGPGCYKAGATMFDAGGMAKVALRRAT